MLILTCPKCGHKTEEPYTAVNELDESTIEVTVYCENTKCDYELSYMN